MKVLKKTIITIFGIVLSFEFMFVGLSLFGVVLHVFFPGMDADDIKSDFDAHKDLLVEAIECIKLLDVNEINIYSSYEIDTDSYVYRVFNNGTGEKTTLDRYEKLKPIESVIDQLFSDDYGPIDKDGNVISFKRWANKNVGRGVAYSIDGSEPTEDEIQYLTLIEPLEEAGWYYYEEDLNEWKARKRAKQNQKP